MLQAVIGEHGCRAGPHLPVQVFRRVAVFRVRPGAHAVVAIDFHQADFAQLARTDNGIAGFDEMRRAAALGARRGDLHHVEVFLAEHLAVIVVGAGFLLGSLARGHNVRGPGEHLSVHVTQGDDLHRRHLDQAEQVTLAIPAAADEADALLLVCGFSGIAAEG